MVGGPAFESMHLPSNSDTLEKRNREIYENEKKKHRELVLISEHEINVIQSKLYATKTHASEQKVLRREVALIYVAYGFIYPYGSMELVTPPDRILACKYNSLR